MMLLYFTILICSLNILQQKELGVSAASTAARPNASQQTTRPTTDGEEVNRPLNNTSSPATDLQWEGNITGSDSAGEVRNIRATSFGTESHNDVTSATNTTGGDISWVVNRTERSSPKGTPSASVGVSTIASEPLRNADTDLESSINSSNGSGAWEPNNQTTEATVPTVGAGTGGEELEIRNVTATTSYAESKNTTGDPDLPATASPTEINVISTESPRSVTVDSSNHTATIPVGITTKGETTATANATDGIKAAPPTERSHAMLVIVLAVGIPALLIITAASIIIVRQQVRTKYSVQGATDEQQMRVVRSKNDADCELQIKAQSYYGRAES